MVDIHVFQVKKQHKKNIRRQFYTSADIASSTDVPVTCYTMDSQDHNSQDQIKREKD